MNVKSSIKRYANWQTDNVDAYRKRRFLMILLWTNFNLGKSVLRMIRVIGVQFNPKKM